jgi:16S rRNA (cytosine1402-N4)-methyltransferase
LREYGEERFASRIADAIVRERARAAFSTTARLAELVRDAIPAPARRTGGNPAKRTFQALRIEVNGELAALARAVPSAISAIGVGGRVAALSYHSLEDRIVKRAFAAEVASRTPAGLPVELPEHAPRLRLLTRGGEQPDAAEVAANPRAASARRRGVAGIRDAGCVPRPRRPPSDPPPPRGPVRPRPRAPGPRRPGGRRSSDRRCASSRRAARRRARRSCCLSRQSSGEGWCWSC